MNSESIDNYNYLKSIETKNDLSDEQLEKLILHGIEEKDPSLNGEFLKPCIERKGIFYTHDKILSYYFGKNFTHKIGALRLFYWNREQVIDENFNKNEKAIINNKSEYQKRLEILIPELENCDNKFIRFFFQWALPDKETKRKYFKNSPETISDLLKENENDFRLKELIKSLYPEIYK